MSTSLLVRAGRADAYVLIGTSLGLDERDFRVNNGFTNPEANDNTTPHPSYPGAAGAVMAIWKAHAEWGSAPHGDGGGDPFGGNVLGGAGANFDQTFQGTTTDTSGNVHYVIPGTSGAVTAFSSTGPNGWRIAYYGGWTWDDGPGVGGAGIDLQGTATRLIGITLGLGNSSVPGATMHPATSPADARSLEADDLAGLAAIYGAAAAGKPFIEALSGSSGIGGLLVVQGEHFAPTNNEVWFTRAGSDGAPTKVLGVASSAGGTVLEVVVPADAADGDVLVRVPGAGGAALSNAFPIDVDGGFVALGPGLGGAHGTPALHGSGDLTPGGAGFALTVANVAPGAPGGWFLGLAEGAAPFKGGVLYAVPWLLIVDVAVDGSGALAIRGAVDASIPPGLSVVMQMWFHDATGPAGFTATNGLRLDIP